MCSPILSNNVSTNNILLQVTVPKRTGRKRKRGSLEPYQDAVGIAHEIPDGTTSAIRDTQYLLGSMSANASKYHIRLVGVIEHTHRFRSEWLLLRSLDINFKKRYRTLTAVGLPDFVWSTTNSPFMQKMREHIFPLDCEFDNL